MTTSRFYKIGRHEPNPSSFGGDVYAYDFDGYISMSDMAARIISDAKFDKQCRSNTRFRNSQKGAQIDEKISL